MEMTPHASEINDVLKYFNVDKANGLSTEQVSVNQGTYGINHIKDSEIKSPLKILFHQVNNLLTYILIAATVLSFLSGHKLDGYVVLVLVIINISIGFYLEFTAEKRIKGIRKLIQNKCTVLRNGTKVVLDSQDLVPGDIVELEEGQLIPADIRIIKTINNLSTVEASLTGESVAIEKTNKILPEKTVIGDRINMLYTGTHIVTGEGVGVVTATGILTELGKISDSLSTMEDEKTLFHHRTDRLMRIMTVTSIVTSLLAVTILYFQGSSIENIAQFSIATIISGIPEGLPSVLTVLLSIAAVRMSSKKALLRNLPSIESLSSVSTIVTDKTGTLTQNVMSVDSIYLESEEIITVTNKRNSKTSGEFFKDERKINAAEVKDLINVLELLAITNNADIVRSENKFEFMGDPTELSRQIVAYKAGIYKKETLYKYKIIDSTPYDQETKFKSFIIERKETKERLLLAVGGAEKVIERLKEENGVSKYVSESALLGYRMQSIAYKETTDSKIDQNDINDLTHLATLRINDPIRPDVPKAIAQTKKAGIRVIMATGDHATTAFAIAKQAGIIAENTPVEKLTEAVVTQTDVDAMSEEEFKEAVLQKNVFARVSPITKMRIAEVLQSEKQVVAMTGDGVNDAPVLKKVDVGFAMGMNGSDVARESSDVILLDDNFSSILDAITEGRTVFANIRRTSFYMIITNFAEDIIIVLTLLMGLPLPLIPIQILWLNLVTDGINDVALATEKPHETILNQKPLSKEATIINKKDVPLLLSISCLMGLMAITLFYFNHQQDLERARSLAFASMVFAQLFNVINMRSLSRPVWEIGYFSNKSVNISIVISFVAFILIMVVPRFRSVLGFSLLSLPDLLITFFSASLILVFGELFKWSQHTKTP